MYNTDLYLEPRVRMNGAIFQLTLYAIIVWTGTVVPLYGYYSKQRLCPGKYEPNHIQYMVD
jgi:hypothetical protein